MFLLRALLVLLLLVPIAVRAAEPEREKSAAQKESDKELYDRTSEIEYPLGSTAKAYREGSILSLPLYYMFHQHDVGTGDVNGDGVITCFDYEIVLAALETVPGSLYWDSRADIVPDKVINDADLQRVDDGLSYYAECGEMMP